MSRPPATAEATFRRERSRIWRFIRSRVRDRFDAEDILQEVFYELVAAEQMARPIAHASGWLFRVARNRIIDRARTRERREADTTSLDAPGIEAIEALLPRATDGPEAAFAREALLEALADALEELPAGQREAFVAHELEGRSFAELAAATGVGVNTLLSRKHRAVLYLRERLQDIYDDFMEDVR